MRVESRLPDASPNKSTALICAGLGVFCNLNECGVLGLITTNSICETDTLQGGLSPIVSNGGRIFRATSDELWPGAAGVRIAKLHVAKCVFEGDSFLDGVLVANIRPDLTSGDQLLTPYRLHANFDMGYKGVDFGGTGFILTESQLAEMERAFPNEAVFVWPLINALDVTSEPTQKPKRQIINFSGMELEEVRRVAPSLLSVVENKIKPDRAKAKSRIHREKWWHYFWPRPELYARLHGMTEVVVNPVVAKWTTFSVLPSHAVFSNALNVFPISDKAFCAILQSTIHIEWAASYGSSMKQDPRYNPSDCFETFLFPGEWKSCGKIYQLGDQYLSCRSGLMTHLHEGLTSLYNRFHNPNKIDTDVQKLRDLHVELDQAVAAAYGWTNLELGHDFHETKQGVRFTISEAARREVLQRLLKLNHERYAEEVKQGLHGKKGAAKKAAPKKKAASNPAKQEASLFDGEDDE